jgi:predicted dehydrogenase
MFITTANACYLCKKEKMEIKWGIIGCGDVTEVKSGPAFTNVNNSSLQAVMRRDIAKAEDYARRHRVPKFYGNAEELIHDPEVNAIYVATPPLYHEEYTISALAAGKPVYVEKPMALTALGCTNMIKAAEKFGTKLTVAHYRREVPLFKKVKELVAQIGDIRFASIQFLQPPKNSVVANTEINWRIDPKVSGGGLFHDMAPHQLDLMLHFFGTPILASGYSANQAKLNHSEDIVSGEIVFAQDILFKGLWCFNVPEGEAKDQCEIIGSEGKVTFPFYGNSCQLIKNGKSEVFDFVHPAHIQQPMIEQVVKYFSGEIDANPCEAEAGLEVAKLMDAFTRK